MDQLGKLKNEPAQSTSDIREAARTAHRLEQWAKAAELWKAVRSEFPHELSGYLGGGRALKELQRYAEAEELLLHAQQLAPAEPAGFLGHAQLSMDQRRWAEAVERWRILRDRFPDLSIGYTGAAAALRELLRYDEADALLLSGQERKPEDPVFYTDFPAAAEAQQHWPEALNRWEKAEASFPQHWGIHLGKGMVLRRLSRFSEAAGSFTKASELNPDEPRPLIELAHLAEARADWSEAAARWRQLQARLPNFWTTYMGAARALRELGDLKKSDKHLTRGQGECKSEPTLYIEYARNAEIRKDWPEVIARWRRFEKHFPDHPALYSGLAIAYLQSGALREAESLLERGRRRYPNEIVLFVEYARLAERRGDWGEAVARWQAVQERFSEIIEAHARAAFCLRKLDRSREALELLESALLRFHRDVGLHRDAAVIAFELGDSSHSVALLRRAIAIEPELPDLKLLLLRILDEGGQIDAAKHVVDELLSSQYQDHSIVGRFFRLLAASKDLVWAEKKWANLRGVATAIAYPHLHWDCVRAYGEFRGNPNADFLLRWMLEEKDSQIPASTLSPLGNVIVACRFTDELQPAWNRLLFLYSTRGRYRSKDTQTLFRLLTNTQTDTREYVEYIWRAMRAADEVIPSSRVLFACHPAVMTPKLKQALINSFTLALSRRNGRFAGLSAVSVYLALMVSDTLGDSMLDRVVRFLCEHFPDLRNPDQVVTPAGVLASVLRSYRPEEPDSKTMRPTLPHMARRPRRLKLCLCISGQLRGFRSAAATIRNLGFDGVDVVSVVHSWEQIGRNLPMHLYSTQRTFQGKFLTAYNEALTAVGWETLKHRYPNLIRATVTSGGVVVRELAEVFATNDIVIEDDLSDQFHGQSNAWKMYYKITECHMLARKRHPDADLYIRLRPDRDFSSGSTVDWDRVFSESTQYRRVFVDRNRTIEHGYFVGDQFGGGCKDVMDAYADCFKQTEEASRGERWSFCRVHHGHESLAYSTLNSGLSVRALSELGAPDQFCDPPPLDPTFLLEAVRRDIATRPPVPNDDLFIAALGSDAEALGTHAADHSG